jgi:hypothetical protein
VSLGSSANGGVAGHICNRLKRHGKQNGIYTKSRRGKRCLNACMSCTDDGNAASERILVILGLI